VRERLGALVAAIAVAGAVGCGSSAANGVARRGPGFPSCAPAGARIIRADPRAQLYALHTVVYGCDRRTRTSTKLGDTTACVEAARIDQTALVQNIAAYGLDYCGVDTGFTTANVRRLSDGKRLGSYLAVAGPGLAESYQSIGSIVVNPDASVAWIASARSIIGRGPRIEVNRVERGKRTLLDSGPAIVASSLRLSRSTLSWQHGSTTRSATLS
jgi:hypothetical protein